MIESNTSLSDEPINMLDQVDFVDILKSRIPEETNHTEGGVELVEISNTSLHQDIFTRGSFTREDLEKLLQNEENLQSAVEFLVKENSRLSVILKSKEEKILTSVDLIVSQRDWVHSLLDDNENLRLEINNYIKSKHDNETEAAFQISALKNEKEETEDKVITLTTENQNLENQVVELDDQIKKSASVLKKSQVHKNALAEKIESMEANQGKYKIYMGILGAAAFVFFSIAVVTFLNNKTQTRSINTDSSISADGTSSHSEETSSGLLGDATEVAKNPTAVDVPPEGFVTSNTSEPVVVDNMKLLDDKKVDEILKQPMTNVNTPPVDNKNIAKNNVVKKDKPIVKATEITIAKVVKPEIAANTKPVNKPSKTEELVIKPAKVTKPEIASNTSKGKKKSTQSYVIKEKDSLYQISKKFYGSGNYVSKIKKENKLGNSLVPGKKLIISGLEEE